MTSRFILAIDVIGRSDDAVEGISRALSIFEKMCSSENYLPNVITFVTMFRALGKANLQEIGTLKTCTIILSLLKRAHVVSTDESSSFPSTTSNNSAYDAVVDITIYNAALSSCVWLKFPATAQEILLDMKRRGSNFNPVTLKIISKLVATSCKQVTEIKESEAVDTRDISRSQNEMLQRLLQVEALTANDVIKVRELIIAKASDSNGTRDDFKSTLSAHTGSQYAGCLGPDATEELRRCVIHHDLKKLLERPEGFSESDFATLIHQCRKRKWHNQVDSVLQFMTQRVSKSEADCLTSTFSPSPSTPSTSHPWLSTESSFNLRRCIVPLTWTIFEAALDAYFCMGMADEAFALHSYLLFDDDVSTSAKASLVQLNSIWFILKGFFRCGRADYAVCVFDSTCAQPSRQLVMGLMHGLGRGASVSVALRILESLMSSSCTYCDGDLKAVEAPRMGDPDTELYNETVPFSLETCKTFLITLMESCAVLGNIEGMEYILALSRVESSNSTTDDGDDTLGKPKNELVGHLLNNLIQFEDCDFIAVSLMGCAARGDAAGAHERLLVWQSPPLQYLPPHLFLHSLLAESFAQTVQATSQVEASSKICSLPFRGFAKFGSVRHLDRKRGFLRRTVPKCCVRLHAEVCVASIFDTVAPTLNVQFLNGSDAHSDMASTKDVIVPHTAQRWRTSLRYVIGEGDGCLSDVSSLSALEIKDGLDFIDDSEESLLSSSDSPREEDSLLTHYFLTSLDLPGYILRALQTSQSMTTDAPIDTEKASSTVTHRNRSVDHAVSSLLLLQHIGTRLLRVRDKVAKCTLQRHIAAASSLMEQAALAINGVQNSGLCDGNISASCVSSTERMLPYARRLLMNFLRCANALDLNGKQSSRLLNVLFESMECWSLDRQALFDDSLLTEVLSAEPCLDILKELQRHCGILNTSRGAATVAEVLLVLLEKDKEKLVKVVMFMRQQQHMFHAVQTARLERLLVSALRNSPEGSWSAVMAYMTGVGSDGSAEACDKSESVENVRSACRRIVRGLLSPVEEPSPSVTQTYISEAVRAEGKAHDLNIARRLLCRYEVSDETEFESIFVSIRDTADATSAVGLSSGLDTVSGAIGEVEYLKSLYSRDDIVWIDGSDHRLLSHAANILLGSPYSASNSASTGGYPGSAKHAVGIDVEWRPFSTGMPPTLCSVLQIGCRSHCFLFDLLLLEQSTSHTGANLPVEEGAMGEQPTIPNPDILRGSSLFSDLLTQLFRDPNILKLGFGLAGDFKRLDSSFPSRNYYDFAQLVSVFDITASPRCRGMGLSAVSCMLLGKPLNKRFQLSDWQKRPLSEDQMVYAADDAGVLVAIYDALEELDAR